VGSYAGEMSEVGCMTEMEPCYRMARKQKPLGTDNINIYQILYKVM